MKLDRRLNLIVPIFGDDGEPRAYIHSTPLPREVFERYFIVIGKAFAAIYNQGLGGAIGGPAFAALMLKKVAIDADSWEGEGGVKDGLMAEIYRLSKVVMPTPGGWQAVPMQAVIDQGLIDADDLSEAQGNIVFFILASAVHHRKDLPGILTVSCRMWNSRAESLNCMELIASLPTSIPAAPTGETATLSSIPS